MTSIDPTAIESPKRIHKPTKQVLDALQERPRLLVWFGLALSLWLSLASTAHNVPVTRQWVEERIAKDDEDIRHLYNASRQAQWRDVPGWFVGPWNYPGVGYYRPITSILFLAENRAFDRDFGAYNRITWLLHGLNTALLFLLTVSLFRERRVLRSVYGLIAVVFFTTYYSSMSIGVAFSIRWWPAQNDVLSLTFGLLSLLILDRYLVRGGRGWLAGALFAAALSIGSKEMGYAVAPAGALLAWHRRRRFAWSMALYMGIGGFFFLLRKLVVPNPWAQNYFTDWVGRKAIEHWGGAPAFLIRAGIWWHIVAVTAFLFLLALGMLRRWPIWTIALSGLLVAALCAQFVVPGGTWALMFVGEETSHLRRVLVYFSAFILAWRYRRTEPALFAILAAGVVFIPILQFVGYHYLYWPGAFVALTDACYCACLLRFALELREKGNWSVPRLPMDRGVQS